MKQSDALVLFDIDGTLIRRAGPHHREALVEAIRRTAHVETTTEGVPVAGMLDRDILMTMMLRAGMPRSEIRRVLPEVIKRAQSVYVRRVPDLAGKVCPGVRGLLRRLSRRGVVIGLVTGNLSRIGWRKMERAGLRHISVLALSPNWRTTARAWCGLPSAVPARSNGSAAKAPFR